MRYIDWVLLVMVFFFGFVCGLLTNELLQTPAPAVTHEAPATGQSGQGSSMGLPLYGGCEEWRPEYGAKPAEC